MSQINKVITPVGTSLFENYRRHEGSVIDAALKYLKEQKDGEEYDLPACRYPSLKDYLDRITKKVKPWMAGRDNASAEITSILKIQKEIKGKSEEGAELEVYLLASDTVSSVLAAELLAAEFQQRGIKAYFTREQHYVIEYLQVHNGVAFQKEGLSNLISAVEKIAGGYYGNLIFNITGGYKATIPYLSIYAQVNSIPIYYIFEDEETLLSIPPAPVGLNWGLFERYSNLLEEVANGIDLSIPEIKKSYGIPYEDTDLDILFFEIRDEHKCHTSLSPLGEFFWKKYREAPLVYVLKQAGYFRAKVDEKRSLEKAVNDLFTRLKQLCFKKSDFDFLKDEDIKHAKIGRDCWVFKFTAPQVRVLYRLDWVDETGFALMILDHYFILSKADDKQYGERFQSFYKANQAVLEDKGNYVPLMLRI